MSGACTVPRGAGGGPAQLWPNGAQPGATRAAGGHQRYCPACSAKCTGSSQCAPCPLGESRGARCRSCPAHAFRLRPASPCDVVPCALDLAWQQQRTRYRLSYSSPFGLGSALFTGTSVPSTHSGRSSMQSLMILGYLPSARASARLLVAARLLPALRWHGGPLLAQPSVEGWHSHRSRSCLSWPRRGCGGLPDVWLISRPRALTGALQPSPCQLAGRVGPQLPERQLRSAPRAVVPPNLQPVCKPSGPSTAHC